MRTLVKILASLFLVSSLSGCFISFQDPKNPYSYGSVNIPTQGQSIFVEEVTGTGKAWYRYSCPVKTRMTFIEKDGARIYKCETPTSQVNAQKEWAPKGPGGNSGGSISDYCQPHGCDSTSRGWVRRQPQQ